MNGNSILLDTNIVLYLLSGDKDLATLLDGKKLYVSFITQLELLGFQGISIQEQKVVKRFLGDCIVIDINNQIKEEVIKIKRSQNLKLPDSIILATSKYLNIPIISSDKAFSKLDDLEIIYYERGGI